MPCGLKGWDLKASDHLWEFRYPAPLARLPSAPRRVNPPEVTVSTSPKSRSKRILDKPVSFNWEPATKRVLSTPRPIDSMNAQYASAPRYRTPYAPVGASQRRDLFLPKKMGAWAVW